MAADVVQKAIQANTIKQGIAIMGVKVTGSQNGTITREETYVESRVSLDEIHTNLNTRFDDPAYYAN